MPNRGPDLRRIIVLVYQWGAEEEQPLAQEIKTIRYRAYQQKMAELAREVGCPNAVNRAGPPRRESKREIDQVSELDAKSIVETWNRDVENQVATLYRQNARGNRYYYYKRMEEWARARARWKDPQIALMNSQMARNLARQDFDRWNGHLLTPAFRFTGPPPREQVCAELMAAGVVDETVVRRNPTPIHIGCPHEWTRVAGRGAVRCEELVFG
jgi:hypothetical protein